MLLAVVVISQAQNDLRERLVEEGGGGWRELAQHAAHHTAFDLLPATSLPSSIPPLSRSHTLAVWEPPVTHILTTNIQYMWFTEVKITLLLHLLQPFPSVRPHVSSSQSPHHLLLGKSAGRSVHLHLRGLEVPTAGKLTPNGTWYFLLDSWGQM